MAKTQESIVEFGVGLELPAHHVSSLAAYAKSEAEGDVPVRLCRAMDGAFFHDALFCCAGMA
eukprot:9163350-Pyramimonas_sp.AAC.1